MSYIELLSLPNILFSHIYKADTYKANFEVSKNFLKNSYISDGSVEFGNDKENFAAKKGDIICSLLNRETVLTAKSFYSHHTVAVAIFYEFSEDEKNSLFLPPVTNSENNTKNICHLIDCFIY